MDREEIIRKINTLICDIAELDPAKLDPNKALGELGQVDSLAVIELAEAMEEEFDISLDDDDLQDLKCLNDVYSLVEQKLA